MAARTVLALLLLALVPAQARGQATDPGPPAHPSAPRCASRAVGKPWQGRLVCGVQLPPGSESFATWDGVRGLGPNRGWRRWGTQKLIDTVESLSLDYGTRFPIGPRLVVGDLSRPSGGRFGAKYGGAGHRSHQNGLDVDIYYPRLDGLERAPELPSLVDRRRAQWIVDWASRSAQFVFVGPNVGLRRTNRRVQYLPAYHDDHMHVRLYP